MNLPLMPAEEAKRILATMNPEQRKLMEQVSNWGIATAATCVATIQERDNLKKYVDVLEDAGRQKSAALTMATQAARAFQDETHQARADMAEQARMIAALEKTVVRLRESYRDWTHGKNPTAKAGEADKADREMLAELQRLLIATHREIVRMNRAAAGEWFDIDITRRLVESVKVLEALLGG